MEVHSETQSTLVSKTNTTGSAPYAGAFFPQASGFNIHGGVFTSNVTNFYNSPEQPSDFQIIRLWDVKLVKEVRLSPESGVVGRQSRGVGVRRIYHAEIRRDPGTVTVAMYQGAGAEEKWRQHIAKYESIQHPNIMQLYGLVSSKGLYAMVFHDELIPYAQFLRRFEHSPILSAYIIGYCATEFEEAASYISDVSGEPSIEYNDPAVWIRPSTGELCLDLVKGGPETSFEPPWWKVHIPRLENVSLDAPGSENIIISTMSEDQYHKLCSGYPTARSQCFQVSTKHPVGPGMFRSDSRYETCVGITEPLQILPEEQPHWDHYGRALGELLPNSWTRYDSRQICTPDFQCALELELQLLFWSYEIPKAWLAQAIGILTALEEVSRLEDYVCVDEVRFILRVANMQHHIEPAGYLFVCPYQDFRSGIKAHTHSYHWPACPAYWSLDPSGADRLSTEDARNLGFPAIHIETIMAGKSWDRSVYEGLRQFHEGKAFDSGSRGVARQLGYPLFEVLSDLDSGTPLLAHNGETQFVYGISFLIYVMHLDS
ncbi:hypothetical protein MSAN_02275600 [Mycena sanguinolenta]|uniref:Protein kinase domain-containing protein n=1 Tax=Mycena sanguinolenta TaxID=230812 RepID=A0A8H6XA38_9AGAR|nr:hypothetical protein MSAN_02275600 [Mycena sanguinolenta]